ncbi:MAG: type II secretion system F family protein [candidate division Zixibacteria bacterium]|nr:type II secretion system F family protein [candidate division Zixibacteria bacterium]
MPETYLYSARTRSGIKRTGIIQAETADRVAAILDEQDLMPISIKLQKREQKPMFFGFMKSQQYEDLIFFTRNLSTLYQAGVPLLKALSIIKIGPPESYFNRALERIRASVESGKALSEAMAGFPALFSKIYTASIAAGEASGKLDQILDALAIMLERDLELNRQIKSAVRYPIMVIIAIAVVFVVIITFVIPRFVELFSMNGVQLPLPTRILILTNQIITRYWIIVLAVIVAIGATLKKIYSSPSGKLFFDTAFLKIIVFGELIIKGNIARFSYMFHLLIKSGIPIVKALEMLGGTLKNSRLTLEIGMLAESFKEGRELNDLIGKLSFFPTMALQMIKVGLESGSIESMLNEISIHYSKEVDYKSRQLTALLEPILTVVLAGFVLVVALAVFLPMWSLIKVFKGG